MDLANFQVYSLNYSFSRYAIFLFAPPPRERGFQCSRKPQQQILVSSDFPLIYDGKFFPVTKASNTSHDWKDPDSRPWTYTQRDSADALQLPVPRGGHREYVCACLCVEHIYMRVLYISSRSQYERYRSCSSSWWRRRLSAASRRAPFPRVFTQLISSIQRGIRFAYCNPFAVTAVAIGSPWWLEMNPQISYLVSFFYKILW